jgi:hypothetical protein
MAIFSYVTHCLLNKLLQKLLCLNQTLETFRVCPHFPHIFRLCSFLFLISLFHIAVSCSVEIVLCYFFVLFFFAESLGLDSTQKVLHCDWHPGQDVIALGCKDFGYLYLRKEGDNDEEEEEESTD